VGGWRAGFDSPRPQIFLAEYCMDSSSESGAISMAGEREHERRGERGERDKAMRATDRRARAAARRAREVGAWRVSGEHYRERGLAMRVAQQHRCQVPLTKQTGEASNCACDNRRGRGKEA